MFSCRIPSHLAFPWRPLRQCPFPPFPHKNTLLLPPQPLGISQRNTQEESSKRRRAGTESKIRQIRRIWIWAVGRSKIYGTYCTCIFVKAGGGSYFILCIYPAGERLFYCLLADIWRIERHVQYATLYSGPSLLLYIWASKPNKLSEREIKYSLKLFGGENETFAPHWCVLFEQENTQIT